MSPKENLQRIIDQLPADKLEELERIAISMLPSERLKGKRGPTKSFEEASEALFSKFDSALRNLAK
jgi:hypothetical protein